LLSCRQASDVLRGEFRKCAASKRHMPDCTPCIHEIIELEEGGRMNEAEAKFREIETLSEQIVELLSTVESRAQAQAA